MAQGKCPPLLQVAAEGNSIPTCEKHRVFTRSQPAIDSTGLCCEIVYKPKGVDMKTTKLAAVCGSAFLLGVVAATATAQDNANRRAPAIRVYSTNGSYALETTSYVTPVIEVGENAYVFAVAEDADGQIQILHPDFPGISVRMVAHKRIELPKFFAGFSMVGRSSYLPAMNAGYASYDDGFQDSRGTVIALASRAPFNLERLESGGDWNISAIRQLIENRSPSMAAQSLANYIGAKGEPIGRDFLRFSGGRRQAYYALDAYSQCDLYYGYAFAPTLAFNRFRAFARINALRRDGQVRILGYDLCGTPIVAYTPSTVIGQPFGHRPTLDSTRLRPKLPRDRTGRPHPQSTSASAAEGFFPSSRRGNLPQIGDVTITAPRGRRAEPGQVLQGYRSQPGISEAPRRVPIERVTTPRMEPQPTTGQQPQREPSLRELRPEPRTASLPPARAPDPPRQSPPPAPVERERPSTPALPPPRMEPTTQRTEPARTPPPPPPKGQ
jgi:hypothetical protein